MSLSRKIATCCYCGTRAILVLDEARHELCCRACGAPLRSMKYMPQPADKKAKSEPISRPAPVRMPVPIPVEKKAEKSRKRKAKKAPRLPRLRRIVEELWDEVEDIFD